MFRALQVWPPSVAVLGLSVCFALPAAQAAGVELLSRIPPRLATETANGTSQTASLSADGRFLVFVSSAPNLVAGVTDLNLHDDVFLYDRGTGETVLVSESAETADATANWASRAPVISADGRFVAFQSEASDLVPGQGSAFGGTNVFLWDRSTGETELVSHAPGSGEADSSSLFPSISADGRFVAFQSHATNLVDGLVHRNGGLPDVFLYDRRTGGITLVSRSAASARETANSGSVEPVISADGRFAAFRSQATDLVSGQRDRNRGEDVFLWDRTTGRTVLVSHAPAGSTVTANGASLDRLHVSADGAFVAFLSLARNLVPGQSGLGTNVYLWTRATGAVTLVTHAASSPTRSAGAFSNLGGLSADGSWILFNSTGSSLVTGQREGGAASYDVFLWSRRTGQSRLVSGAAGSSTLTGNGDSFGHGLSADGDWAVLSSVATNLVSGARDSVYTDVFLWNRRTGRAEILSHAAGSPRTGGSGASADALISADGRWIAYTSYAPNLDAETRDTNGAADVVLESRFGEREIVSLHAPGAASATPGGSSQVTSIDASGRWVTFLSTAPALIPGQIDTNNGDDVFLFDRATGAATLVSHAAGSPLKAGNGGCLNAQISADGRFVALICKARNLVPGQTSDNLPDLSQLFLWSRETGAMALVTHAPGAPLQESDGTVYQVAVSTDASVLAFVSSASDLVPGQTEPQVAADVFAWVRTTDTASLLSGRAGSPTVASESISAGLRMSADGRIVAFESYSTDLVAGVTDANNVTDVFVHDRALGTTTLLSRAVDGLETVGGLSPRVSADGRFVVFNSPSTRLVAGQVDSGESPDLFLWDREAGTTRLVSHTAQGPTFAAGGVLGDQVDLDAAGRFVAYASLSTAVVPGQEEHNTLGDVFLFDRESGVTVLVSQAAGSPAGATGDSGSGSPRISADGRRIAFLSWATDLTGSPGGRHDQNVFSYDRISGQISLLSPSFRSPARRSDSDTLFHVFAASGNAVAFTSLASDLVLRDFNDSAADAFAAALP
ncbi:MAG TPA: hypothetical protein VJ725_27210 [Thermoanaerobaculia bacterium]|nr:hypothetical protein [Thermoanaerobaculia bacterium]